MRIKEALKVLKPKEKNMEALKVAYRAAALKFHPDRVGESGLEIMKIINLSYETLGEKFTEWTAYEARSVIREGGPSLADELLKVLDKIKHLAGVKIEIIGTWIWCTGETKPYREFFKELGFKFSGKKVAWYFHSGPYRKWSKKKFDLDEIRGMFGSEEVETEAAEAIG